jgi:hypothetical protein
MKEKIRLSTWIIVGIAVVSISLSIGYLLNKNDSQQGLEPGQAISAASTEASDISDLQQQITDLKNKSSEIKNETITKDSQSDYSSIISEWQDRVARVVCTWTYVNGEIIQTGQGSGTLVNITNLGVSLVTNHHVVSGDNNGPFVANWCVVGVYGKGARVASYIANNSPFVLGTDDDWAYIKLGAEYNLPGDPVNTDDGSFDTITSKHLNVCSDDVALGDKLVILGYPAIGTQGGITATEGIVSGIEGDYYVTSAKIDHGNSGGAAILVKDDCYLGIPTWADSGGFESLGRILKAEFVLSN